MTGRFCELASAALRALLEVGSSDLTLARAIGLCRTLQCCGIRDARAASIHGKPSPELSR